MNYIKKSLSLSTLFILLGCGLPPEIKPDVYYLPEGTIGQPYYHMIQFPSIPSSIRFSTWPEDSGLTWRFGKDRYTNIEIIGIPKDNHSNEIKIGMWGSQYGNMFSSGIDFYKEYMIKLAPSTNKPTIK